MGLGLSGAYGAAALRDELLRTLAQRRADQQYKDTQAQQQVENELRRRTLDQNEQFRRDQLTETTANRRGIDEDRNVTLANALADQIPGGTFIPQGDPAASMLQQGGRGSLLTAQTPQVPSRQMTGLLSLPGVPAAKGTTINEQQTGERPAGFLKTQSANQANVESDNARALAELQRQFGANAETKRHNVAMENKPGTLSTVTIQTVDDQGRPITRVIPKEEAMGQDFKARPNATTANRLDSAEAVVQTGQDIIRQLNDPKIAAEMGPVMGRYNSLQEFIGNPPPGYEAIAGEIESFSLANMGVHGMRSAQGAQMIRAMLNQRMTPQALSAAINGLMGFTTHFIQNAGRDVPQSQTPPPASAPNRVIYDMNGNVVK